MPVQKQTISEINEKLKNGEAVIMTAMEFKKEVRDGRKFKVTDVDVVTTATRGIMSGTSAMLVLPIAEKGTFKRLEKIWLNGVPCFSGSDAYIDSGMVDTVVYGTQESRDYAGHYGGGHLLRDIVEGKEIQIECLTSEGKTIYNCFTLSQLKFARIYSFRNDFQNYYGFANIKNLSSYRENPHSIFSCRPLPVLRGMGMSGSGELNPLENDPHSRIFRAGMKILVNKSPGVVIGYGTRSNPKMRAISVAADMVNMDPEFMGGFKTGNGVEVINSIAVPFPILNQNILDDLSRYLDENIPLHLADIGDRIPLIDLKYSDIWSSAKLEVEFDPDRCIYCSFQCSAEYYCPMGAISWKDKTINDILCFGCGACTANCLGGAFMGKGDVPKGRIGQVHAFDTDIPVIFRQSNRFRSQKLAEYLKEIMGKGEFFLNDSDMELKHWNI
ncbi:MAG: methanogenesis marker 16 metalloprotein [Proteobacteria bacterium]|nr:methanogenesis marker 16 metalloprotein [Pseudomonadota bacterium]MBU1697076.1 methanogenesis marker 16 metalloprotein [Pseudomonadota bacterium]